MNECRSWVYEPRRSKIGSSKEIVGECKYSAINRTNFSNILYNNQNVNRIWQEALRLIWVIAWNFPYKLLWKCPGRSIITRSLQVNSGGKKQKSTHIEEKSRATGLQACYSIIRQDRKFLETGCLNQARACFYCKLRRQKNYTINMKLHNSLLILKSIVYKTKWYKHSVYLTNEYAAEWLFWIKFTPKSLVFFLWRIFLTMFEK